MTGRASRRTGWFVALAIATVGVCLLRLLIDRDPAGGLGLAWPEPAWAGIRRTAVITGIIVGAALAVSGVLLQALLRNPLASPFILGISAGAGLGITALMYVAHVGWIADPGPALEGAAALGGALLTSAIVYALGRRRGWLDPVTLILVGVVVSTMAGAGMMFFQHLVPEGLRGQFLTWLMGHLPEHVAPVTLIVTGGLVAAGTIAAGALGRAMDAATLADDEARTVGLAIGPLRVTMFLLAGALAAIAVALAGPIGFVGLVAPHAARLLLGPRHGPLVFAAALCGIIVVVGADAGRQGLDLGAGRMPIGVITALLGGPAFIWLLCSGRGQA